MNDVAPSPGPSDSPEPTRLALLLRAFSHRNYRLFFSGQIVSLVGTFLTQVAIVWLVYDLTNSERLLGVVAFAGQIPMFLLAPFAGVWVDRLNLRRLLVITQTLSMLESLGLAALAFLAYQKHAAGSVHQAHAMSIVYGIIALSTVQGLINAFDMPGRQAFLVQMVTRREDLGNAIALNSTMVHGARLIGPAIAGFLIHFVGPAICFLIDGCSYIGVIAALLAMHVVPRPTPEDVRTVFHDLREGLRYIWNFKPIRVLLLVLALLSLTGMPAFTVLMPVFGEHFGGKVHSAETLGLLMGSSGLGAFCAAIYLGSRRTVVGLGRLIAMAMALFGFALIGFSFASHLWICLVVVPIAGFGMLICFASANTLLQTLTEDHMRGRVMSLFSMAFAGMLPWGSLLTGDAAAHMGGEFLGATRALKIAAALVLITCASFTLKLPDLRRIIRPIYVKQGILPAEVGAGMQTATEVVTGPEY